MNDINTQLIDSERVQIVVTSDFGDDKAIERAAEVLFQEAFGDGGGA